MLSVTVSVTVEVSVTVMVSVAVSVFPHIGAKVRNATINNTVPKRYGNLKLFMPDFPFL